MKYISVLISAIYIFFQLGDCTKFAVIDKLNRSKRDNIHNYQLLTKFFQKLETAVSSTYLQWAIRSWGVNSDKYNARISRQTFPLRIEKRWTVSKNWVDKYVQCTHYTYNKTRQMDSQRGNSTNIDDKCTIILLSFFLGILLPIKEPGT